MLYFKSFKLQVAILLIMMQAYDAAGIKEEVENPAHLAGQFYISELLDAFYPSNTGMVSRQDYFDFLYYLVTKKDYAQNTLINDDLILRKALLDYILYKEQEHQDTMEIYHDLTNGLNYFLCDSAHYIDLCNGLYRDTQITCAAFKKSAANSTLPSLVYQIQF